MGVLDTQQEELHMGMELYKFRSDRREDQLAPESYMGQRRMTSRSLGEDRTFIAPRVRKQNIYSQIIHYQKPSDRL